MIKVKRVVTHGKFSNTLPLCGETIQCPECLHTVIHGGFSSKPFDVGRHTDGEMWVITCPECKCTFHAEQSKEKRR